MSGRQTIDGKPGGEDMSEINELLQQIREQAMGGVWKSEVDALPSEEPFTRVCVCVPAGGSIGYLADLTERGPEVELVVRGPGEEWPQEGRFSPANPLFVVQRNDSEFDSTLHVLVRHHQPAVA